jgi:hypothetical protein
MSKRSVTTYLVLEKKHGWGGKARIVRHSANPPDLKRGQVAVRVELSVPEEAFEPRFAGPSLAFEVSETLQAEVTKERP